MPAFTPRLDAINRALTARIDAGDIPDRVSDEYGEAVKRARKARAAYSRAEEARRIGGPAAKRNAAAFERSGKYHAGIAEMWARRAPEADAQ